MGSILEVIEQNDPKGLVRQQIQLVSYKKGDIILGPEDDTEFLYAIRSGLVKVYSINDRGEEVISVIYGKGEFFPLTWIVNEELRGFIFKAMTDCEVGLLPNDVFLEQLKTNPAVSFAMTQKVIEQYMLYASRITNLGFKFGRERLAYWLLLLAARFGDKVDDTIMLPHISQSDLAATINMTRESVSREMTRFERMGFVNYASSRISIIDPEKLRKEISTNQIIAFYDASSDE